ncbi:MAG: cell division protein SepF [Ruminococcaceae bacterium]|nr:cell division protein SepF [Oscillospiraceae bacterium]
MGIGDKIKKILNVDEGYFDEVETGDIEYEPVSSQESSHRSLQQSTERRSTAAPHSTKVVDIHTTAKLQVVLKKPERFDEAMAIADELLDKRTVVLNLEATLKDEAGKLLCFLSGVAYANGGKLKKIANNTYIITPYNVDVMGDLLDELENNGMFFV